MRSDQSRYDFMTAMGICMKLNWNDAERILKLQMRRIAPADALSSASKDNSLLSSNEDISMNKPNTNHRHNDRNNNRGQRRHTTANSQTSSRAARSARSTTVPHTHLVPSFVPAPARNLKRKTCAKQRQPSIAAPAGLPKKKPPSKS